MIILGIDPGLRHTGYCVVSFTGQRRTVLDVGEFKACTLTNIGAPLQALLGQHEIDVAGIEDFHWMGGDKTIGKHSLELCKLIGVIFSTCQEALSAYPILLRKQDCNAAIGVTGKTPKRRVAQAVRALFPGVEMSNEHKRDAAVVCMASKARAGR